MRGNTVTGEGAGPGISASGVTTNNYVNGVPGDGIVVGVGGTVLGNTSINNGGAGIRADCPSNLIDNTAIGKHKKSSAERQGLHQQRQFGLRAEPMLRFSSSRAGPKVNVTLRGFRPLLTFNNPRLLLRVEQPSSGNRRLSSPTCLPGLAPGQAFRPGTRRPTPEPTARRH